MSASGRNDSDAWIVFVATRIVITNMAITDRQPFLGACMSKSTLSAWEECFSAPAGYRRRITRYSSMVMGLLALIQLAAA